MHARMFRSLSAILITAAAIGLAASPASGQGGAIILYENGSPDMASAYAGASARAQDAATAFQNPAGMTHLDGNHLLMGTFALFIDSEFDLNDNKSISNPPGNTNGGGDLDAFVPGLGSFMVFDIGEKWRVGASLSALAAAGVDYDSQWIGRTFITESDLIIAGFTPSVAYQVNDWMSVGVGLNVVYGNLNQQLRGSEALNAPTIKIDDADDWGLGVTIGLMFEPVEGTRIGFAYRSQIDLTLSGDVESPLPDTINFDTDFDLPQGFNLGVFHQLTDTVALLGDVGWTDWSHFDRQPLSIGPANVAIPRDWNDTWRIGVGGEWMFREGWKVRGGFSYDSSPMDDDERLPDIPVGDQYRFSVGLQHDFGNGKIFGVSYSLLWQPMDIDQVGLPDGTVIDGEYDTSMLHFLSFNLGLQF